MKEKNSLGIITNTSEESSPSSWAKDLFGISRIVYLCSALERENPISNKAINEYYHIIERYINNVYDRIDVPPELAGKYYDTGESLDGRRKRTFWSTDCGNIKDIVPASNIIIRNPPSLPTKAGTRTQQLPIAYLTDLKTGDILVFHLNSQDYTWMITSFIKKVRKKENSLRNLNNLYNYVKDKQPSTL